MVRVIRREIRKLRRDGHALVDVLIAEARERTRRGAVRLGCVR
jgi:hypothetical protein